jgi:hypothetical protein
VDTIIMHESLGRLLSFDDHLQFIGRLRRCVAIYNEFFLHSLMQKRLRGDNAGG